MTALRRTKVRAAALLGATALAVGLLVALVPATTASGEAGSHLARVRAATARFHRLEAARAAGYVDLGLCFDHMGEHWGLPEEIDATVEATAPEALVYAHAGDRLRLVAVEYVATAPGTVPGIGPLHYNATVDKWVLHAWLWKHNHDGMHADFNPAVGLCP